uniref:Mitochondrial import inner membrane translocase subunit TIM50 n=1 Tax=Cucumis melo TaxID=3656 RepID=A0A9I9DVL9_CUCME
MAESSTNKNKARASKYSSDEEEENRNIDLGLSMKSLSLGPKKKLLIMGIGGFLCHRVCYRYRRETIPKHRHPDASYGSFYVVHISMLVYKRPFCEDFMKFCLERWYLDSALDSIMHGLRRKLLFAWDQGKCTKTCFFDLEKKFKPIFLKELKKVWEGNGVGISRPSTQFCSSNTLLIDNEPYKVLLNPPHTAIFPKEYKADDIDDDALGAGSELRRFLEKVAEAKDVPNFIKHNPFGNPPISPYHPNWDYYSKIISTYEK